MTLVLLVACGSDTEPLGDGDGGRLAGAASSGGTGSLSPVEEYLQFASSDVTATNAHQQRMSEGLRKLAGALGTLNIGALGLQVDLRVAAEHLLLNPSSPETTALVRDALTSAADAIQTAADGGDRLRQLAQSVRPGVPLRDQRATVHQFFQDSASVIARMSRPS